MQYLIQQGYYSCEIEDYLHLNKAARFMPLMCMLLVITGLIFQVPAIHLGLALLGLGTFFTKSPHPFDRLYSLVLRWFGRHHKIPENPLPRRYACLSAGILNLVILGSFVTGHALVAYITGALLVSMQLLTLTTHFCLASWLYERLFGFLHLHNAISLEKARKLRLEGALLVDVRTPNEYYRQALTGSMNIPSYTIHYNTSYHDKELLVYCTSGLRAKEVVDSINSSGFAKAHNLGGFDNALKL